MLASGAKLERCPVRESMSEAVLYPGAANPRGLVAPTVPTPRKIAAKVGVDLPYLVTFPAESKHQALIERMRFMSVAEVDELLKKLGPVPVARPPRKRRRPLRIIVTRPRRAIDLECGTQATDGGQLLLLRAGQSRGGRGVAQSRMPMSTWRRVGSAGSRLLLGIASAPWYQPPPRSMQPPLGSAETVHSHALPARSCTPKGLSEAGCAPTSSGPQLRGSGP